MQMFPKKCSNHLSVASYKLGKNQGFLVNKPKQTKVSEKAHSKEMRVRKKNQID